MPTTSITCYPGYDGETGWNAVGFFSPTNNYTVEELLESDVYDSIWGYNPAGDSFIQLDTNDVFEPGKAYWIETSKGFELAPDIEVSPTVFHFGSQGEKGLIQLRNRGDGEIDWQAMAYTDDGWNWLGLKEFLDDEEDPATQLAGWVSFYYKPIYIFIDSGGLVPGEYTGHIRVVASAKPDFPVDIEVTMTVEPIGGDYSGTVVINKVDGKNIPAMSTRLFASIHYDANEGIDVTTVINSEKSLIFPHDPILSGGIIDTNASLFSVAGTLLLAKEKDPFNPYTELEKEISRQIWLETTMIGSGNNMLGGVYRETIQGMLGKPIEAEGVFQLHKVDDTPSQNVSDRFGYLEGTVIDDVTGQPITGATVILTGAGIMKYSTTLGNGAFSFHVPDFAYLLNVQAPGYESFHQNVNFDHTKPESVTMRLVPVAKGTIITDFVESTHDPIKIPDAIAPDIPGNVLESHLDVAQAGDIESLIVFLDIFHEDISELVVTLVSPEGTSCTLHNRAPGKNLIGTFRIEDSFMGENPKGIWTLRIIDYVPDNKGMLNSWSLTINLVADTGGTWATDLAPMPGPGSSLGNSGAPVVDGMMYIIGPGNIAYRYHPEANIWTVLEPPPGLATGVAALNNNIYAIGPEHTFHRGVSSPWPMFHHNAQRTGRSPYKGPQTDSLKWTFDTAGQTFFSPVIGSHGTIYICNFIDSPSVYAIHPNGSLKWDFSTGGAVRGLLVGPNDSIFFGSYDGIFYALNPDGTAKWQLDLSDPLGGSPAIDQDGTLYIGSMGGKLYAILSEGSLKWTYTAGSSIWCHPAIDANGTIYVGSRDRHFHAINPDGTAKWKYLTGGDVDSSPAIGDDGSIYVGSQDGDLYAFHPDGTFQWAYDLGGLPYFSSPAIAADGTIYIGSSDNNLHAVNADGTPKWKYTTNGYVVSPPSIGSDGTIYFGSEDKNVYALTPDGALQWKYTVVNGISESSPAIGDDGSIYIGSGWGRKLYAFGKSSTASDSWLEGTPMPVSVEAFGYTVLNEQIYIIGGDISRSSSTTFQRYTRATDTWVADTNHGGTLAPLPQSRSSLYCGVINGKIHAIGGRNDADPTCDHFIYDPDSNTWSAGPPIPQCFIGQFATTLNNNIYVFGGDQGTVFKYSEEGGWSSGAPMPTDRVYGTAAVYNGKIYVIGGEAQGEAVDVVEVYDPGSDNAIALFTENQREGLAPLTVQFNALSDQATDWVWDFGDEYDPTPGSEKAPTHTYSQPGNYTVSLTATGQGGSGTVTKPAHIQVSMSTGPGDNNTFFRWTSLTMQTGTEDDAPPIVSDSDKSMTVLTGCPVIGGTTSSGYACQTRRGNRIMWSGPLTIK